MERTIIKAIKHDIAIYAIHTNLDNVHTGVNRKICEKIGLKNMKILVPKKDTLSKLVTYHTQSNMLKQLQLLFMQPAPGKSEIIKIAVFNSKVSARLCLQRLQILFWVKPINKHM